MIWLYCLFVYLFVCLFMYLFIYLLFVYKKFLTIFPSRSLVVIRGHPWSLVVIRGHLFGHPCVVLETVGKILNG